MQLDLLCDASEPAHGYELAQRRARGQTSAADRPRTVETGAGWFVGEWSRRTHPDGARTLR